jgi:hypothetical protein
MDQRHTTPTVWQSQHAMRVTSPEGIDLVQPSAKRESVEKESTPLGRGRRPMAAWLMIPRTIFFNSRMP